MLQGVGRFLKDWWRVTPTVWFLRAFLFAVGIEALEDVHGWPRIIPVVLAAGFVLSMVWEYVVFTFQRADPLMFLR